MAPAQIVHANRLAEDLFGSAPARRPYRLHERDPELLAAVDEALETRQSREVELHGACRWSGGCWQRSPLSITPRSGVDSRRC